MSARKAAYMAECKACDATGVYLGYPQVKDEAVECLVCNGTGKDLVFFVPFTRRKRRRGIVSVRISRGTFIATGVGGVGQGELYKDWFKRTTER
jgi:hypothetical protein